MKYCPEEGIAKSWLRNNILVPHHIRIIFYFLQIIFHGETFEGEPVFAHKVEYLNEKVKDSWCITKLRIWPPTPYIVTHKSPLSTLD